MVSSEGLADSKSQEQISEILRIVWQCVTKPYWVHALNNNDNNSSIALYPVNIYELKAL